MYVRLLGGRLYPDGIIVPCDIMRKVADTKGRVIGAYVRLSSEDGSVSWVQYAKVNQLINDEEAEREEVG